MSDEKLRRDLVSLGYTPGPITDSTRKVLEKKLQKLRAEARKSQGASRSGDITRRSQHREPRDDSDDESPAERRRQPPRERGTVLEESRRRGADDTWLDGGAEDGRERALWERAAVSEDIPERSSYSTYTSAIPERRSYTSAIPERSSLSHRTYTSAIPERSSLGYSTYTSDLPDRRSYTSDIPERSSIIHRTYTSDLPDRRSYTSAIPERSSLGYSTYTSDLPERRSYTSDIPERSSIIHRTYTSDIPEARSYTSDIPDRRSYTSDIPEGRSYTSDIPERRSYTSDILDRRSYTSDIPDRSSLSYKSHASVIPERRSLDFKSYPSDPPESSSIGYKRYPSDTPESSSLGYKRYPSDTPESSSLGYDRHSSELRYRPIGERLTSPYISSSATALGSVSHKTRPELWQEKASHSKPAWSKKLEHYLSRLLRLLCVILVLVFAGILIVKSGILSASQDNGMKLLPSDCEGRGDPFCKTKQKEITLQILSELYDFLSLEAGSYECGNPSALTSKCIPVNRAKEHVMNVSGYGAEKFGAALDWILNSDKHFGIWAKNEDPEKLVTERADIFCLESSRPRLGFGCRLKNALYTAISNLFLALLGIFILWIIMIFLRHHWQRLEEEEKQMFAMVEKIIDVVKQHYKDCALGREQNPYVGILHVRDSLIMPQDRKRLKKVWERAEQFVKDHESRIRTEQQRVAGADLNVWRWIQTRNDQPR